MKFGILICKPEPRVPRCCDCWEIFEVSWSKHTPLSHPVKDASTESRAWVVELHGVEEGLGDSIDSNAGYLG